MKITGTKSYIQIEEENGNIARFDGEACLGEFYAYASPIRWVRHRGEATDGDRIDLIYRATRYGKETDTRVLFFNVDGSVMFETELGLKTEVCFFKGQLLFPVVVVLSLLFSALLIAALNVVSPGFYLAFCQSVSHLDAADLQVPARSRGLRRYVYSCFWKKRSLSCECDHPGRPQHQERLRM